MTADGWGLRIRMAIAVCFLLAFDVVFVRVAVWFLTGFVPFVVFAVFGERPPNFSGLDVSLPVLLGLAGGFLWLQFRYSRYRMNMLVGARIVSPDEEPQLHARVNRLAQQALVEVPTVAVAEYERPNSLLVGSAHEPTLVVTTGLLDSVDGDALDAVLAHEIGHLANGDAWVMTAASFLPMLTEACTARGKQVYANIGGLFRGERKGYTDVRAMVAATITATVLIAVSRVFWLASFVVFRVFSRYREYAADDAAAELVGDPAAVAAALSTLDADANGAPKTDMRTWDDETRAICFLPHGLGERTVDEESSTWLESTSYRWRSLEPEQKPVERERKTIASNARASRMNWGRIDDLEAQYENQPMANFDPDERNPATLEDFLPLSHPPTERRIDRLMARV